MMGNVIHAARDCPGVWGTDQGDLVCGRCGARVKDATELDLSVAERQNQERSPRKGFGSGGSGYGPGTRA